MTSTFHYSCLSTVHECLYIRGWGSTFTSILKVDDFKMECMKLMGVMIKNHLDTDGCVLAPLIKNLSVKAVFVYKTKAES